MTSFPTSCNSDQSNVWKGFQTGVVLYTAPEEKFIAVEDGATVLELGTTERLDFGSTPAKEDRPRPIRIALRCSEGEEDTQWGIKAGSDHNPLRGYGNISARGQNTVCINQEAEWGLELHVQEFNGNGNGNKGEWDSTRWSKGTSSWEPPRPMAGHRTTTQIAAAVIKETLYIAFRNLKGDLCIISTTDLESWTRPQHLVMSRPRAPLRWDLTVVTF